MSDFKRREFVKTLASAGAGLASVGVGALGGCADPDAEFDERVFEQELAEDALDEWHDIPVGDRILITLTEAGFIA